MGNERANCYWEAELPPNYDRVGIENFIRAKYVDYFLFLSSLCSFSGIFSSLPLQIVKVSIYSKMEKLSHMLLHYMNDNDIYPFLAISSKRFPKYPPWGILYIKSKQIRNYTRGNFCTPKSKYKRKGIHVICHIFTLHLTLMLHNYTVNFFPSFSVTFSLLLLNVYWHLTDTRIRDGYRVMEHLGLLQNRLKRIMSITELGMVQLTIQGLLLLMSCTTCRFPLLEEPLM